MMPYQLIFHFLEWAHARDQHLAFTETSEGVRFFLRNGDGSQEPGPGENMYDQLYEAYSKRHLLAVKLRDNMTGVIIGLICNGD